MADLTRFWIVPSPCDGASNEPSNVAAAYWVEGLEGARSSADRGEAAHSLGPCSARGADGESVVAQSPLELLDALAPRHGGREVRLLAPRAFLDAGLAHALGVADAAELGEARNLVLDWPTRNDPLLRCAFIGLDLDWSPPPPPERAARFPGGPGAAASRRQ